MNFVYLSPHYPPNFKAFCKNLSYLGVRVLGIADTPYEEIGEDLQNTLTEYYKVSNLEDYDQVYRAALGTGGHVWSGWRTTIQPTCTNTGRKVRSCTICGQQETEIIPALGHATVFVSAQQETCGDYGLNEHWHCTRCNKDFQEEAATHQVNASDLLRYPTGHHDLSAYEAHSQHAVSPVIIQESTFTDWPEIGRPKPEHGRGLKICAECGNEIEISLPFKKHVFSNSEEAAPGNAFVVNGLHYPSYITGYCQECHEYRRNYNFREDVPIDRQLSNHTVINTVSSSTQDVSNYTPATCDEYGYWTGTCILCGDVVGGRGKTIAIYHPQTIALSKTSYIYNGKEQKPTAIIKDTQGNIIDSSNYTITYSSGCKNVGEYKAIITFKEKYEGTKELTFKINKATYDMSKVKFENQTVTYNGKNQSLKVTGLPTGVKVTYTNNSKKKIGEYKVTAKFTGDTTNYNAIPDKTAKLTIVPKGTKLSKLTKGSKQFKATWKAQKTETTGYELQYATNSKFTSGKKTVKIKKNKTTSSTVKKLKSKKKYYVRIRTYKTVNGKKYCSGWSKVLNVKTK